MRFICLLFVFLSTFCIITSIAIAAPSITSINGTVSEGSSVVISGSNFGIKSTAKPLIWAPFNSGSINPSSLGQITSWTNIESMGYVSGEGPDGTGCAKATDSSGVWTLGVDFSGRGWAFNDVGQTSYIFRKLKINFDIDNKNWKSWRLWPASGTNPNVYIQLGTSMNLMNQESNGSCDYLVNGDAVRANQTNAWATEEMLMRGGSPGYFYAYTNGTLYANNLNYPCDFDRPLGAMLLNYPVHGVIANASMGSSDRTWYDDVYLDNTWSRVILGNASTLSSSSHREIQIPSAWSASGDSITVTVHTGTFSESATAYLFVCDSDNSCSAGYQVTVGSGGGDTTAPTVSISPSIPDPSSITSDSLAVSGTASDAEWGTGSACKWRIGAAPDANNGTTISGLTYSGTVNWSFTASGFSRGSNTLYVGCRDAVPNWGSKSMAVNYNLSSQGISGVSGLTVR